MQNNNFPFEMREVDRKQAEDLMMYFKGELTGFIQVGPKSYFFPIKYREIAADIYTMTLRQDDIFVASFPRSGTTWTQELVWMLANDLNYEKSSKIPIMICFPMLDISMKYHANVLKWYIAENQDSKQKLISLEFMTQPRTELLAAMSSQRFIKTHLPMSLIPSTLVHTAKIVYVARDPRDVAVSYYHLNKTQRVLGYVGDFKSYWSYLIKGLCYGTPYFDHLKEAVKLPVRSLNVVTKQLFIRKGKVGGWKEYFDEVMAKQAEDWIAENLKGTDLSFP